MAKYDGSLLFDTRIDTKGFKKGVGELKSQIGKAAKIMSAAILGVGVASVKVGADFNKSMSEVQAISGATGKDLDRLRDAAKEMGATTKFSASESADALKYMAMAGWDTEQMLAGLPGVIHLAAASGEDLALVSDIVTDALTAFGMEASQAAEFADLLASASSNANTDVSMLGESFKYAAPVAGALGYTAEDTALALGLMADAGIKGSQSGTALRSILTRMAKPTKDVQFAMDQLGISLTDANGEMIPFEEQMVRIREAMSTMEPEEKARIAAMLAGQQGMSGLLAIANASEDKFEQLTEATRNYTGAAKEMAETMEDNLVGDWTIFKSTLESLGIAINELVDGPLRKIVQSLTEFVDSVRIAIEGPEALKESFESANEELNEVPDRMLAIEEHMEGMVFGVEGVALAIQEFLIAALEDLKELFPELVEEGTNFILHLMEGFQESIPLMAETIVEVQSSLISAFLEIAPEFVVLGFEYTANLMRGFSEKLPELIPLAQEAIQTIVNGLIEHAPQMLGSGMEIVAQIALGIAESIPELITSGLELIVALGDAIIANLDILFDAALEIVKSIAKGIADNFPLIINEAPRLINEFSSKIYDLLPKILKTGVEIIVTLGKGLIKAIPDLIKNIPQIIKAIVNVFTLHNWAKIGTNIISGIGDGIKGMASSLVKTVKGIADNVMETIRYILNGGSVRMIGRNLILGLTEGIKSMASGILNFVKSLGTKIIGAIKDIFTGNAGQVGRDLVNGLWNGISNMTGWILDKVTGFGNSIMNSFKSVFGIKSPSRRMKDEVGVEIVRGIAAGIQEETPELRRLTDAEMDKVISDYGKYGKDAIKEYGKLSKEELDKLKKEYKDKGNELTEAIAKGQEEKVERVAQALDKIRDETIKQLDQLGDATITALRRRYEEEERIQLESLNNQVQAVEDASREKIAAYQREMSYKLQLIDDGTNAEVKALQEQIDKINQLTAAEEEEERKRKYQERLANKERELETAKTSSEVAKIKKEIQKIQAEEERRLELRRRQERIQELRDEIKDVQDKGKKEKELLKDEYDTKIKNEERLLEKKIEKFQEEIDATKEHYAILLEEENLQAEARILLLDENNQELVELLESYYPDWHDAGQSFGESLLDGLNSMKYEIEDVVDEIMSMVATAEMANARIIQAKLDYETAKAVGDEKGMAAAHKRAERYRAAGGDIGADDALVLKNYRNQLDKQIAAEQAKLQARDNNVYSRGVTQNITIVSPENTPAENARQMKRRGEELALGY